MSASQPNPQASAPQEPSEAPSRPRARSGHVHRWQMTAHLDFCHSYTSVYACTGCSATASTSIERDPNSFSHFMWEEQYEEVNRDARGRFTTPHTVLKVCQRCDELKAGSARRHDMVIIGKDGKIEREEHTEIQPE